MAGSSLLADYFSANCDAASYEAMSADAGVLRFINTVVAPGNQAI
jgi:hypothetical protein